MDQDSSISQKTAKKTRRRIFLSAFACLIVVLCLMLSGVPELMQVNPHLIMDAGCTFGITSCENPVYRVVQYRAPERMTRAALFVATTEMPAECVQALAPYGTGFQPIAWFSHEESSSQDGVGHYFWTPIVTEDGILFFYSINQTSGQDVTIGWNQSDRASSTLNALAEKTSEETPLYLVMDELAHYAVIGDTAYYFSDAGSPSVDFLPEIYTGDNPVYVARID